MELASAASSAENNDEKGTAGRNTWSRELFHQTFASSLFCAASQEAGEELPAMRHLGTAAGLHQTHSRPNRDTGKTRNESDSHVDEGEIADILMLNHAAGHNGRLQHRGSVMRQDPLLAIDKR